MTARFDSDRSSGEDWGLQSVAPIDAASSLYLIGLFLDPGRFFTEFLPRDGHFV